MASAQNGEDEDKAGADDGGAHDQGATTDTPGGGTKNQPLMQGKRKGWVPREGRWCTPYKISANSSASNLKM